MRPAELQLPVSCPAQSAPGPLTLCPSGRPSLAFSFHLLGDATPFLAAVFFAGGNPWLRLWLSLLQARGSMTSRSKEAWERGPIALTAALAAQKFKINW